MNHVIAVANVAGGTGKTTTAHALAVSAVEYGKKVLLLDFDVASALTFKLGFENERTTLFDYLMAGKIIESQVITTTERFDFIASDSRLGSFIQHENLKAFLSNLPKHYDLIFIDTPSTLDARLSFAIEESELVVIPIGTDLHSIRGADQIRKIAGQKTIVTLKFNSRNSSSDNFDYSYEYLDAAIPYSELADKALEDTTSVITQNNRSEIASAYREAAYSILEKLELI